MKIWLSTVVLQKNAIIIIAIYQKKILALQRDSNPMMASVLVVQCSTDWAKKTHTCTLGAGQLAEFILTREWNETWNEDDVNCRNTNLNENNYHHSMFHLWGKDELNKLGLIYIAVFQNIKKLTLPHLISLERTIIIFWIFSWSNLEVTLYAVIILLGAEGLGGGGTYMWQYPS